METIKLKKCNKLNEKDLAEIYKIMDNLNESYQGDIKFWYRKGKYLVNCNDNKFFKITKKNNLKLEKNVKKLILCYYDIPLTYKKYGNVNCDINIHSIIFSLDDNRSIFNKWCLILIGKK